MFVVRSGVLCRKPQMSSFPVFPFHVLAGNRDQWAKKKKNVPGSEWYRGGVSGSGHRDEREPALVSGSAQVSVWSFMMQNRFWSVRVGLLSMDFGVRVGSSDLDLVRQVSVPDWTNRKLFLFIVMNSPISEGWRGLHLFKVKLTDTSGSKVSLSLRSWKLKLWTVFHETKSGLD